MLRAHKLSATLQLPLYSHARGQILSGSISTVMPGPASVNLVRNATSVESSVHAQSGAASELPRRVCTVASERTVAQGCCPFIPARLVGCASNWMMSFVAVTGK